MHRTPLRGHGFLCSMLSAGIQDGGVRLQAGAQARVAACALFARSSTCIQPQQVQWYLFRTTELRQRLEVSRVPVPMGRNTIVVAVVRKTARSQVKAADDVLVATCFAGKCVHCCAAMCVRQECDPNL